MNVLGLETSTAVCSVGLFREGKPPVEHSVQESHIHSEKLLTLVQLVARDGEIDLDQIDAIAVSIGPGSFTGLRIGLSTAKGLAYALDKPLVAVSTFEAIAEAARGDHLSARTITVLIDAKKDECYIGQYVVAGERVKETLPVHVRPVDDARVLVKTEDSSLVLTDRVPDVRRLFGETTQVIDVHASCRGAVVAAIGYRKATANEFADVAALEPTYLKDFVIRTVASVS